jgi:primosomal replication protein N
VQTNRLLLDARLAARGDLRFTPAGIPALDFSLEHESMQTEAGIERRVACELAAVALGPVAKELASVSLGAPIRCNGFLVRRYRTGTSVALHVNEFELIDNPTDSATEGN